MAVTECFSAEKENAAIDLIAASVTEELGNDLHLTPEEILPAFLRSRTGTLLYDRQSKLWWDGPSHIAELYKKEIEKSS